MPSKLYMHPSDVNSHSQAVVDVHGLRDFLDLIDDGCPINGGHAYIGFGAKGGDNTFIPSSLKSYNVFYDRDNLIGDVVELANTYEKVSFLIDPWPRSRPSHWQDNDWHPPESDEILSVPVVWASAGSHMSVDLKDDVSHEAIALLSGLCPPTMTYIDEQGSLGLTHVYALDEPMNWMDNQRLAKRLSNGVSGLEPESRDRLLHLPGTRRGQITYTCTIDPFRSYSVSDLDKQAAIVGNMVQDTFIELEKKKEQEIEKSRTEQLLEMASNFRPNQRGNAELLVDLHGDDIRHAHDLAKWFIWDNQRWGVDKKAEIDRKVFSTIDTLREIASVVKDSNEENSFETAEQINRWALNSESASAISGTLRIASSIEKVAVTSEIFDKDKLLLNTPSGTLDLRTGTLRKHCRADYISMVTKTSYSPYAACPLWMKFIEQATGGDKGLQRYLRQMAGYFLHGENTNQLTVFIQGPKQTGKSTFTDTLLFILGDYAVTTEMTTFVAAKNVTPNAPRSDLTRLIGKRYILASENEENQELAAALIKRMSGGDKMVARELYGEHKEFDMSGTLVMQVNELPIISTLQDAIWRRVKVLPFHVKIPDEQRDDTFKDALKAETEGILAWAVEGFQDWQRNGFVEPMAVTMATNRYRADSDHISTFLKVCCLFAPSSSVPSKSLYDVYVAWCSASGVEPVTHKALTRYIKEHTQCTSQHTAKGTVWSGIGIRFDVARKYLEI